jgi:hypothetical protein
MTLLDLQNRVISLAIKLNQADVLNDLQYFTEVQWLGIYLLLLRLQGN